ncbi:MAG: 2,3-bisphosphoglycerate-independent phosphoglycerate mutase [Paracoccaceae bacterium]
MPPPSDHRPVVLCILDGWGLRAEREGNAPALARTPNVDALRRDHPTATLVTHGRDVGLPTGQMGNSEVGHTNIGAGRVVAMDLGKIDLAIEDGSFDANPRLDAFARALEGTGGTAHLMGVVSDGGVHGHVAHLAHVAGLLAGRGIPVAIHAITDGRDVAPGSAEGFVAALEAGLPPGARIATVTGRYFAMDRDTRWDRVEAAFLAMVHGRGEAVPDARTAAAHAAGDEFVPAHVVGDYAGMRDGDGLFCLNFRADRAREILAAMSDPGFDGFARDMPALAARLGMVDYSTAHDAWFDTVFPKERIENTLGAWVAAHGLRQFRVAETEKYPHVTFFLNGGAEAAAEGEVRAMPRSPDVATYDLAPQMSAGAVTDALVGAIRDRVDLIVVNYANPDMVGHTGDLEAAIAACEAVDAGLGRALEAVAEVGGAIVVTADHGNCETMIDPDTGRPHTAHTTNLVEVSVMGGPGGRLADGRLADLAPTVLDLMGLEVPPEMTGRSLIRR